MNLFLIVTKKWYDEIASGGKRVEYRANSDYWQKRLSVKLWPGQVNAKPNYDTVEFQCGYSRRRPRINFKITKIDVINTPDEVQDMVKTDYCFAIYFE
jgi:hypothetical protein